MGDEGGDVMIIGPERDKECAERVRFAVQELTDALREAEDRRISVEIGIEQPKFGTLGYVVLYADLHPVLTVRKIAKHTVEEL